MRRSQRLQCSLCVQSAAQFLKCAAEEPSRRTLFCEHTLEYLLMNERKGLLRRLKRLWVGHRTLLVGEGSARSIHPALGVAGGKDAKGWQCPLSRSAPGKAPERKAKENANVCVWVVLGYDSIKTCHRLCGGDGIALATPTH